MTPVPTKKHSRYSNLPHDTLRWLLFYGLAKLTSTHRGDYLFVSPPWFAQQRIYDRKQEKLLTFPIRDDVDRAVLYQIYGSEDYRLQRLARYDDLMRFYEDVLRRQKCPLIVDCGANTGHASIYFDETFPSSTIIAIEPDPMNAASANENSQGRNNIRVLHAGIANVDGRGEIANPDAGNWAYQTRLSDTGSIEMVSMNSLLADPLYSSHVPFIAKIDIEGFERDLFEKNTEWVDRFPLLIVELHDRLFPGAGNSNNFLRAISSLDRDFYYFGENVFSVKNGI